MAGLTPVALITRSAASRWPFDRRTDIGVPASIASTRVPVKTCTPFFSHHSLIMPPAVGPIMRGTMRSPISTTDNCTPRAASDSMMMQPMKPAPICSTRAPLTASAMILRASSSVQQGCTPGRSMPGMGGRTGVEPVAISKVSKRSCSPLSSVTVRAAASRRVARACTTLICKASKWLALLRSQVPDSPILPISR